MPAATPPATYKQKTGATTAVPSTDAGAAQTFHDDENKTVRLHITPFSPALLKIYLAPSVLPLARNISYHTVETFPEKGFGYVELPEMEAKKIKKKLHGSTLKGSKVRIEDAKPEKRKAIPDPEHVKEDEERPKKRSKKAKKEQGVLEGVELPEGRSVKRGWTEPPSKHKKDKREKKAKDKGKDKDKDKDKKQRKESKYSKEPELLFKAKLTPVAATELASKQKKKDKKDKKSRSSKKEVIVHEFEKKTNMPSFLKEAKVTTVKKPAVDYINGVGWVDEDGNVVEAETGKVRNRRVLELVDAAPVQPTTEREKTATPSPKSSPAAKPAKKEKKAKKATPPPSSSESDDESSVVSSSSEDESSDSDDSDDGQVAADSPVASSTKASKADTPEIAITASSPSAKEVHPLEALFKRPKPSLALDAVSTPSKGLAPINTAFSFFDNGNDGMDVDEQAPSDQPVTPYTQRDLEWRGQRSAAPTPDTAAVGRRFSFPWRNGSQEADEADEGDEDDMETQKELSHNTKANATTVHLPGVAEEDEEDEEDEEGAAAGAKYGQEGQGEAGEGEEESEFKKWFWENQGSLNRAWKKRRRDALKSKRLTDNKKAVGGRKAK